MLWTKSGCVTRRPSQLLWNDFGIAAQAPRVVAGNIPQQPGRPSLQCAAAIGAKLLAAGPGETHDRGAAIAVVIARRSTSAPETRRSMMPVTLLLDTSR